jgi:hypothetical protein
MQAGTLPSPRNQQSKHVQIESFLRNGPRGNEAYVPPRIVKIDVRETTKICGLLAIHPKFVGGRCLSQAERRDSLRLLRGFLRFDSRLLAHSSKNDNI